MHSKKIADVLSRQPMSSCSGTNNIYRACMAKVPKSDMLLDACGHSWCPEHRQRGELLNWGAYHNYPAITFRGKMRYSIGVEGYEDNKFFWESSILMGTDDLINAAMAYIEDLERQSQAS